jgi:hypothetical protein
MHCAEAYSLCEYSFSATAVQYLLISTENFAEQKNLKEHIESCSIRRHVLAAIGLCLPDVWQHLN